MNLPNQLTVARLILTIFFLLSIFWENSLGITFALIFFLVAGITDALDGAIARRRGLITNFGILMDPLADKILICSAFIAFVERGWVPGWMVVIVVARELAITGLRLLAASQNVVLAAEGYGKHKTVSQIVAIVVILLQGAGPTWGQIGHVIFGWKVLGRPWIEWAAQLTLWWALVMTFLSGALYLWKNRALYLENV